MNGDACAGRVVRAWMPAAVAAALSLALLLPMLASAGGQRWTWPAWLQCLLATPVQFWLGAPFYRGAWRALRGGRADMDVVVALGSSAAYGLSLVEGWAAAQAHGRGAAMAGTVADDLYFAVAALVVTLALLGRRLAAATSDAPSGRARGVRFGATARGNAVPIPPLADRVSAVVVPAACAIAFVTLLGWGLAGGDWQRAAINAVAVLVIACPCALGLAAPAARLVATGAAARRGILIRDAQALALAQDVSLVAFARTGTLTEGRPKVVACVAVDGDAARLLALAAAVQSASAHPLARAVADLARSTRTRVPRASAQRAVAGKGVAARVHLPPDPRRLADARVAEALAARAILSARTRAGLPPGTGLALGTEESAIAAVAGHERELRLGSTRWMTELGVDLQPLAVRAAELQALGRTVAWLADLTEAPALRGLVAFGDRLRDGAIDAVQRLQSDGLRTVMISGDAHPSAGSAAQLLGLAEVHADVMPGEKASLVASLRSLARRGSRSPHGAPVRVAMVGDAADDGSALAAADIGIAIAPGAGAAMQVAAITLMRPDPRLVADALDLARRCGATIHQNVCWALACSVAGTGLAAAGWLSPLVASAVLALGGVGVGANSLLLRRWRTRPARPAA